MHQSALLAISLVGCHIVCLGKVTISTLTVDSRTKPQASKGSPTFYIGQDYILVKTFTLHLHPYHIPIDTIIPRSLSHSCSFSFLQNVEMQYSFFLVQIYLQSDCLNCLFKCLTSCFGPSSLLLLSVNNIKTSKMTSSKLNISTFCSVHHETFFSNS